MLTRDDNELLTRTGPDTPMGQFFRRFWQPVALSRQLPEADGAPHARHASWARIWSPFATRAAGSGWSRRTARIAAPTCISAATRTAPSAASSMAGSSISQGKAVELPNVPPRLALPRDDPPQGLPDTRVRRDRLGLPGARPGATDAGGAAAGVRRAAGVASLRHQEAAGVQLGAVGRRRRSTPRISRSCTCRRRPCVPSNDNPTMRRPTRSGCAGSGTTRCRASRSWSTRSASWSAARAGGRP